MHEEHTVITVSYEERVLTLLVKNIDLIHVEKSNFKSNIEN